MTTMQIDDCVICFDRWRSEGDHQICCLPCGHLFGFSCIIEWRQRKQSYGVPAKCPECKKPFRGPDVRRIYGSPAVVLDEDLRHRIHLEEENELLTLKNDNLCEENTELRIQVNIHRASLVKNTKIKTE